MVVAKRKDYILRVRAFQVVRANLPRVMLSARKLPEEPHIDFMQEFRHARMLGTSNRTRHSHGKTEAIIVFLKG